jgi:hypothetical protein
MDQAPATADAMPVYGPDGKMMGNQTSAQGQQPTAAGALAPQSPLAALGPPPVPTPPPQYPALKIPPAPPVPHMQQINQPPPDAKDYQKGAMEFASAMAVLGAVAGRFTRAPGGAALGAFAGAVKGWQTGNLQAYETAAKQWEQQTKQALDNNRVVMEQYKLTLENRKMNIDEQMSQIQLLATKYHDQMMYDAAGSKYYTMVANIYEKNMQFTEKATEAAAKLQEKREEQRAKNEQSGAYWLSPQGQAELNAVNPDGTPKYNEVQKAGVKQLIDIYGQKQVGKSAIAQDRQQYINEFTEQNGRKPTIEEINQWEGLRAGMTVEGATVGRRAGNIAIAVQEAHDTVPNVLAAAEKSAGHGSAAWNAVENKWNVQKGDANFAYYVQQINSLINVYGRVISGGGKGTVSDLEHAREMLNPNMPLSAVKGSLKGFETEIKIAETAPEKVRAKMRGGNTITPGSNTGAAPASTASDSGVEPSKMSDDDLRNKLGL